MDEDRQEHGGLSQVYADLRPQLLRFLTARLRDAQEAEEVLQDLAVRVLEARVGPVANPAGYLHRMALNLANDRIRQRQRQVRRETAYVTPDSGAVAAAPVDPVASPERILIARETAARVVAALERMPPGAARVLRMHKLEGIAHADIAKQLGISRSGVEKHMAVALRHLVRALRTEVARGGGVIADD